MRLYMALPIVQYIASNIWLNFADPACYQAYRLCDDGSHLKHINSGEISLYGDRCYTGRHKMWEQYTHKNITTKNYKIK